MMPSEALITVSKLQPKPGDLLVFSTPFVLTSKQRAQLADALAPHVPHGTTGLLLMNGMTVDLVRAEAIVPTAAQGVFTIKDE